MVVCPPTLNVDFLMTSSIWLCDIKTWSPTSPTCRKGPTPGRFPGAMTHSYCTRRLRSTGFATLIHRADPASNTWNRTSEAVQSTKIELLCCLESLQRGTYSAAVNPTGVQE